MFEKIKSVHYLNNEKMDRAHQRLTEEVPSDDAEWEIKKYNNVDNTPKRKIFRILGNPFRRKTISN